MNSHVSILYIAPGPRYACTMQVMHAYILVLDTSLTLRKGRGRHVKDASFDHAPQPDSVYSVTLTE